MSTANHSWAEGPALPCLRCRQYTYYGCGRGGYCKKLTRWSSLTRPCDGFTAAHSAESQAGQLANVEMICDPASVSTLVTQVFGNAGFSVAQVCSGLSNDAMHLPHVVLTQPSYPGFEAHLFTMADASFWIPEFTPGDRVVLYYPWGSDDEKRSAWERLLESAVVMSRQLAGYRERIQRGLQGVSVRWAHGEKVWEQLLRPPVQQPLIPEANRWEKSIMAHITVLRNCGFVAKYAYSGLTKDHPTVKVLDLPTVWFDDESYIGVDAHLFTLADMAQWLPSFGEHGIDVIMELSTRDQEETRIGWKRLASEASTLKRLLRGYRTIMIDDFVGDYKYWRIQRFGFNVLREKSFVQT
ncbi:MAG: hypothetical protein C4K49_10035 [Candidatus Thorarchaeota archaeon]|nr:MAG: hypothetical protein C4K49_10035 [Candidatus Thorarchaeota archaeon]